MLKKNLLIFKKVDLQKKTLLKIHFTIDIIYIPNHSKNLPV